LFLGSISAADQRIRIDAGTTSEAISPLIYGQFIEHLGRCIYGGLWAEMLEDRKFYYPVTGEAPAWEWFHPGDSSWEGEAHPYELLLRSPWMVVGPFGAVTMVTTDPYVGEHSPQLTLPPGGLESGLEQGRLALRQGREYSGRVVLSSDPGIRSVEISLIWGSGASDRQDVLLQLKGNSYQEYPFSLTSLGSSDNGRLRIVARGTGSLRIGAVSLMPADNILGWRSDTIARLKELDAPVYRWPGGNFVSGYNWRDGIGERDRRPPRKNPAWKGIEHNDVGIHEFMDLCREIGAEPYVAVNTGLGGPEEAARLVEYCNGASSTPEGMHRARNGHPKPFDIKLWAVGNEMYGDWQLGHIPLSEYVKKHREVVARMRQVDPQIQPVAVGSVGQWSQEMLTSASDSMFLISEHLYWQDKPDLAEHVRQAPESIRKVAEAHRAYREQVPGLKEKNVRIALDEWNYWYGPNEFGELGTRYFLQDGLGIAAGLHELFRNSDLFHMANYAQTVNVIGAIKTTGVDAEMEATGLVLALYRHHYGSIPVRVIGAPEPLDVAAAWVSDHSALTVAVVNPTSEPQAIALEVTGAELSGRARKWALVGSGRMAHNSPGSPRQVDLRQVTVPDFDSRIDVGPMSVALYWLEAE